MATEATEAQGNGHVPALRAIEAPTEVQLGDAHPSRPAYVDVSDGAAARKPIIPAASARR